MKKRYIFLDFDGCLTCQADGSYFNTDPQKYHASDRILTYLKAFCIKNDVKIVISSNWRKFEEVGIWTNGHGTYKNPLPKLLIDLGSLCIGTLSKERHIKKSQCLIEWFIENGSNCDYVVFDDDLKEGYQYVSDFKIKDHFILCDPKHGITHKNLQDALSILNNERT